MKKILMVLGVIAILFTVGIGAHIDEKNKFTGTTWRSAYEGTIITFNANNTATVIGNSLLELKGFVGNFNYSIVNQKIIFSSGSSAFTLSYILPQSNLLLFNNDKGDCIALIKQ